MNIAGARASVLVTDAGERSALAAIRSLDVAGYRDAYVARLEEIVRDGAYDVLLPGSDFSLLAISEHRTWIEPYVEIGLPSHEVVRRALSKAELARAAAKIGLDTPTTIACEGEHEVLGAARRLGFPVIAKSASTVIVLDGKTIRPDSRLLADEASLRAWLVQQPGTALLQRHETGAIYSCAGVMTAGGLAGLAFARYTRTWPPRAGNASFAETLTPPEDLRERVTALIEEMAWRGIFELELIRRADDSFVAIDLNPRVYGSLTLCCGAMRCAGARARHYKSLARACATAGRRVRLATSRRWLDGVRGLRPSASCARTGIVLTRTSCCAIRLRWPRARCLA